MKVATWLAARPEIARVLYPALERDPGHAIWKRDFLGASGLFGIIFKPVSEAALAAFCDGLEHFGLGYSWGGYESLIVPADILRTASAFKAEGPVFRIHTCERHRPSRKEYPQRTLGRYFPGREFP